MIEREQFEAAMRKQGWSDKYLTYNKEHRCYDAPWVDARWEGWKLAAAHYEGMIKTLGDGFARVLEGE